MRSNVFLGASEAELEALLLPAAGEAMARRRPARRRATPPPAYTGPIALGRYSSAPNRPGVYNIYNDEAIVYTGETKHLRTRLSQHHLSLTHLRLSPAPFTFTYAEMPGSTRLARLAVQRWVIQNNQPALNHQREEESEFGGMFAEMESESGTPLTPAGVQRAVSLNSQYSASLGWGEYAGRIARLLGFSGAMPSPPELAQGVARWQQGQAGLAVDGIIGPKTLPRMRAALGLVPNIDLPRAIRLNRQYGLSLGWHAYRQSIAQWLLGLEEHPSEVEFAERTAIWQQGQQGLLVDGIVGPQTLPRMQAALGPILDAAGTPPSPPGVITAQAPTGRLRRAMEAESTSESEFFVVEQRVLGRSIIPRGHERLTEDAALVFFAPGSPQLRDLLVGVVRVDELARAFTPGDQRRHCLRQELCQEQAAALRDARSHLEGLHLIAISPIPTAFEMAGEALHLIQDSYSNAHTERILRTAGPPHPIIFIRFFGSLGCTHPLEHRVFPPPDPRDFITVRGGGLTDFARAGVAASREYLRLLLRHRVGVPLPVVRAELAVFMDRHLILSGSAVPTRTFYPKCPGSALPPYRC
jgi:peptidoglycan hydrolase-like protein with peptidoglycan-binding domain